MAISSISIPLDAETAKIYENSTPEEKKKLRLLLSLWLREFAVSPKPLKQLMDEVSAKAEARGLTPETLESLLNAG